MAARSETQTNARGYHYGAAPQGLVNLRFIAGRRAALDLTSRQYYVSALGAGAVTPTMVTVTPSTTSRLPMTLAAPPKRRCQNP